MSVFSFQLLADIVLLAHFSIVLFVIGGLVLIFAGNKLRWHWVNRLWFRVTHLLAIAIVIAESWLGITCPLTTLESWLRSRAGETPYTDSFIEHWVQSIIFYDAPNWLFTTAYTLFGLLVVMAWWLYPPKTGKSDGEDRI